jgi:hypothetical protein
MDAAARPRKKSPDDSQEVTFGRYSPGKAITRSFAYTFGSIGAGVYLISASSSDSDIPAAAPIGVGLVLFGLTVGPSTGYFYADMDSYGWGRMGLRAGLLALSGVAGIMVALANSGNSWGAAYEGTAIVMAGALAAFGIGLYDMVTLGEKVEDQNRRRGFVQSLTVSPTYFAADEAVGLSLRWNI